MTFGSLIITPRWESTFNNNKKEKNYENLMNSPQKLGKIIANKTVKDVVKNIDIEKRKKPPT